MATLATLQAPAQRRSDSGSSCNGPEIFYEASVDAQTERGDGKRSSHMGMGQHEQRQEIADGTEKPSPMPDRTGTHLFTITERSSITTMKTLPPNTTFQHHIISARQQIPELAPMTTAGLGSLKRRQFLSLDDDAINKIHATSDV